MSPRNSLYEIVHGQFREAFGQPHKLLGSGEQWTLQPTSSMYKSSIHVLLNGTADKPGVWIFDPHDQHNGVENTAIHEVRQIDEIISLVQQRLDLANRKPDNTTPPPAPQT